MTKIISHILNFLLIIFIIILSLILIFKFTILNKEYVLKTMSTTNYYHEVYKLVENTIENNLISSGLDESIIKSLFTEENVTNDIKSIINNFYDQKAFNLSSETIRQNFNNQVNSFLSNNIHQLTKEERQNIKELENKIIEIYEREITCFGTKITRVSSILNILTKIINIAIIILSLIILNILAIDFVFIKNNLKNIGTSLLASGLIFLICKVFISSKFQNILIFNSAISNLILTIINNILKYILSIGLLLTATGLGLIILHSLKKQK